jgi:hypothetical protein
MNSKIDDHLATSKNDSDEEVDKIMSKLITGAELDDVWGDEIEETKKNIDKNDDQDVDIGDLTELEEMVGITKHSKRDYRKGT